MKTKQEIQARIKAIEKDYRHILTGTLATVQINAPRALQQVSTETELHTLHWVLGSKFKSKLKGRD